MQSLSILFLLFAAGGTQASFLSWQHSSTVTHPASFNCTSTLEQVIVESNETYLNIQGSQVESSCIAGDVAVDKTLLHVNTQEMAVFYDASNVITTGQVCDLTVSGRVQQQEANDMVTLEIPIAKVISVECATDLLDKRSWDSHRGGRVHHHRRGRGKKHTKTTKKSTASTTKKPTSTTKKPTSTTKKPTSTTKKPTSTTKKPTTTKNPTTTTNKPTSTTTKKPTTTIKPTTTTKKPTTTTTTKKPTTTSSNSNTISGQVTWFNPNVGACGDENSDSDMIAALGGYWYGNMNAVSKYCGRKISITGPKGNSIIVTVKDACPPCAKGHVDISPAAFAKLGSLNTGILKVNWHFL